MQRHLHTPANTAQYATEHTQQAAAQHGHGCNAGPATNCKALLPAVAAELLKMTDVLGQCRHAAAAATASLLLPPPHHTHQPIHQLQLSCSSSRISSGSSQCSWPAPDSPHRCCCCWTQARTTHRPDPNHHAAAAQFSSGGSQCTWPVPPAAPLCWARSRPAARLPQR